jgi:hypothetical protein
MNLEVDPVAPVAVRPRIPALTLTHSVRLGPPDRDCATADGGIAKSLVPNTRAGTDRLPTSGDLGPNLVAPAILGKPYVGLK